MKVKNNLEALNNALFAEIEAIQDESMTPEQLEMCIKRSQAVAKIAETIVRNGELALKTMQHLNEYGYQSQQKSNFAPVPVMLETRE